MTTTDHAQEARDLIAAYMRGGPSAQVVAAAIEAHATLAVAHELKTANLIAALSAGYLLGHDHEDEAWDVEIRPRLGLAHGAE